MSGNPEAGKKAAETAKARYGDDYHTKTGIKGGQWKGKKGFAIIYERMSDKEKKAFHDKRKSGRDAGQKIS